MASLSRASSASCSGCLADVVVARPTRPIRTPARSRLVVRAQQQPQRTWEAVKGATDRFLQRYDPVATGTGAMLVCGWCVAVHGQPVSEALNTAAAATVLGMVMQELLFNSEPAPAPGSPTRSRRRDDQDSTPRE